MLRGIKCIISKEISHIWSVSLLFIYNTEIYFKIYTNILKSSMHYVTPLIQVVVISDFQNLSSIFIIFVSQLIYKELLCISKLFFIGQKTSNNLRWFSLFNLKHTSFIWLEIATRHVNLCDYFYHLIPWWQHSLRPEIDSLDLAIHWSTFEYIICTVSKIHDQFPEFNAMHFHVSLISL